MAVFKYTNTASEASLVGAISSSATSVELSNYQGWPSAFPFWAEIARGTVSAEVVEVSAFSGGVATIVRGQDGTTASSHSAGDSFEHVAPAEVFNKVESHVAAGTAHGAGSALVGRDDTGTLSNKVFRGAHEHVYTDADPAGAAAGFEVTADSTALRDGFRFDNEAGDPDQAALRTTQTGADRVVVYADGTAAVTPSGSATRRALDVAGEVAAESATVSGGVSAGGAVSAETVDLPAPAAGATTPRVTVRTQTGQRALDVVDSGSVVRTYVDELGHVTVNSDGSADALSVAANGATFAVDGTAKIADDTSDKLTQVHPNKVELTSQNNVLSTFQTTASGQTWITPGEGTHLIEGDLKWVRPDGFTENSWNQFSLQNGWSASSAYGTAGYRRSADGICYLHGVLNPGDTTGGTVVAILPSGFRPGSLELRPVACRMSHETTSTPRVLIRETGEIEIHNIADWFSLGGAYFHVSGY